MNTSSALTQLADLRKQREALLKKQQRLQSKTQTTALAKILRIIKEYGLSAQDIQKALGGHVPTQSTKGKTTKSAKKSAVGTKKVAPKYRNPANPEQTWTGRGVSPVWVRDLKAANQLDTAKI